MLKSLTLEGIGPAAVFGPVAFAPRLNVITGDNGLDGVVTSKVSQLNFSA